MDRYYPIPYIGTGGAIGNSVFFFLSGFGVCLSYEKSKEYFKDWYFRRIGRIYPSLWIVLLTVELPIMILDGRLLPGTVLTFIGYFFSPPYWFLQMLLVYYLLTFRLLKEEANNLTIMAFFVLGLMYLGSYVTWVDLRKWSIEKAPFDLIHYFMVFLFGIYIAKKSKGIGYSGFGDYLILMFCVGLVYLHKYIMLRGLYSEYQILQQAAMYPTVYYMLKISRSPLVISKISGSKMLSNIVKFLSENTLEIYIVHSAISFPIQRLQLPFPINVIVFIGLSLNLSVIVRRLANEMRKRIL